MNTQNFLDGLSWKWLLMLPHRDVLALHDEKMFLKLNWFNFSSEDVSMSNFSGFFFTVAFQTLFEGSDSFSISMLNWFYENGIK